MEKSERNDVPGTQTVAVSVASQATQSEGRKKRRVGMWLARAFLLLCFLAGLFFSVIPAGRVATRAVMVLPGLLAAAQPGWQQSIDEPFEHIQKTISSASGNVYLDIYAPTDKVPPVPGSREGIVVIPGVGDERQVGQLINFSESLARSGVVVMDMTTPTLIAYRLDSGDEEAVVQAFQALQAWPGVGANRIGFVGFSGGGPLMCFAAADPRIQQKVAFLTLFGSYFDATTLLQAIGRRALDVNGHMQPWNPVDVPLQVLANTIAPWLPVEDGQLLTGAFDPGGSEVLTSTQIAQLSPGGMATYHLLAGDQPGRVAENLAALPPAVKALLTGLSVPRVIKQIRAPVYLLHDRNDQFVPFTESREFATALAGLHHPYDFAEFSIFQHVEVRSGLELSQLLGDGKNLVRLIDETLQTSA